MRVLNVQRMSTEDGPGLRTTVFVKGCPLRCLWCHNPESVSFGKQVEWLAARCIGCGTCLKTCPRGAISATASGMVVDAAKCVACGACADACPGGALEMKGTDRTPRDVYEEVVRDRAYFGETGGVTLSGGEITAQAEDALELLRLLHDAGIRTAVDTCGMCPQSVLERFVPHTDVFLYDLKLADPALHRRFTGADNAPIISNFLYLAGVREREGRTIWVRTPVIPGATDSPENVRAIARIVRNRADRWELLAFNNLCRDKYERLHVKWQYAETPLVTQKQMDELVKVAKDEGVPEVYATGAVRLDREE